MTSNLPIISPKTLALAADAARAARFVDVSGAASAVAAFRDLQQKTVIDLGGVRAAVREAAKMGQFAAISESMEVMGVHRTAGLQQSLVEMNARNAAAVREAFQAADLGAKWRAQVADTMKLLNLSEAIRSQIAESAQMVAKIPRAELAPRFVAAVADAQAYADLPEVREVAAVEDFEQLSASEKRALQGAVLVAVSEIGTLFVSLHRGDPVGAGLALIALLATLLVIHDMLAEE